jgi:hypothetical protein
LRRRTIRTMRRSSAPGGKGSSSSLIVQPSRTSSRRINGRGCGRGQLEAYPATRSEEDARCRNRCDLETYDQADRSQSSLRRMWNERIAAKPVVPGERR